MRRFALLAATLAVACSGSKDGGTPPDTTPPAAPVISAPRNGTTLDATDLVDGHVVISGMAEAGATVEAWVGAALSTAVAGSDGAWSAPFSLASGTYTARARATDAAGNASPFSADVTFSVETTRLAVPLPVGSPAPVTSWGQTVPVTAADASGLAELFPGQANSWVLDRDFSLGAGFGLEYANALALYIGTPTGAPSHGVLLDDLLARRYAQFPGDQDSSEAVFLTPLFGVPDGVVTAAASNGATLVDVPPLNGTTKGFLNGTSDSRLAQVLTLDAAPTHTFGWTHAAFLDAGRLVGAPLPEYRVVLRDPISGDVLATLFSSSTSVVPASESVGVDGLPAQVVLSFELRSAAPGYAQIDDVTVTGGVVANGDFEAGLAGWTANDGAESQNVRSGARQVASASSTLRVTRTFYAPPGATWGRLVDVFENTGATEAATTAIYVTLLGGGDTSLAAVTGGGVVGWDAGAAVRDVGIVYGAGSAYVADFSPFVFVTHDLTVPAGGKVALVHFVVQLGEATGGPTSLPTDVPQQTEGECGTILAGFTALEPYRMDLEPGVRVLVANF